MLLVGAAFAEVAVDLVVWIAVGQQRFAGVVVVVVLVEGNERIVAVVVVVEEVE